MRRARHQETVELNITAFMNLMVALVPFLLITAVFTQLTIKELDLPDTSQSRAASDDVKRGLTVVIREAGLTLTRDGQTVEAWPKAEPGHAYTALGQALAQLKNANPAEDRISLLLEPGIAYDVLIQVMDAVHYLPAAQQGVLVDMYPRISIGDAPEVAP
jgi:biopolymer transport protein ExbD